MGSTSSILEDESIDAISDEIRALDNAIRRAPEETHHRIRDYRKRMYVRKPLAFYISFYIQFESDYQFIVELIQSVYLSIYIRFEKMSIHSQHNQQSEFTHSTEKISLRNVPSGREKISYSRKDVRKTRSNVEKR